jgi:hypothetical protein
MRGVRGVVHRLGGWRTVRWLLAVIGLALLVAIFAGLLPYDLTPQDAHAYWAVDLADPYRHADVGAEDAFLYAPAIAQLLAPFTLLSFAAFRAGLVAVSLGALGLAGAAYTLLVPGVIEDLVRGNVHVLLAVAILAGFRYPGAWSLLLLTKVTPGIGIAWFAIRREWRALGQVAAVTAAVVAISVLIGGIGPWEDWVRLLVSSAGTERTYTYLFVTVPPFWFRLPFAVAVVAWAALTGRRWAVPVASLLALPVIWPSGFALLAAVPPLWLADNRRRSSTP